MSEGFTCRGCGNLFLQAPKCVGCGAEKLYDSTVRLQGKEIEYQAARIAELEAALLNLIEHTLDCEIELNKLHGLGNGAGAGTSSVLCEAHAALEGRKS